MNITKVTYEDKEAIQNDETIAEKNKVTANNMNQIKKTINDNADVLTEVKNTVDELNEDVGNIKTVQTAQNSTISNMNNAIVQNSEEIYENANNIVELQKENTALKEELKRQKEDNKLNGLTEDNEGEMLHITNTTGARFNSLEIFGNEKQETRSGKNIYGAGSKWFNNIGGTNLNISERTDSSCVLTATGRGFTSFGSTQAGGGSEYRTEIEPNTEYTFSLKAELLSGSNGFGMYAFFSKDSSSEYFSEKHIDYADEITFVTPEDAKYFYFRVDIFNASASYRISEIQLEKGSKATEFEEYGAMPSFDHPSEVKVVGDNINLFSTEYFEDFSNNSGATHETIDDMIKVSTSSESQFSGIYLNTIRPNVVELNNKIKGKTVTYSFEVKADENINLSFGKTGNVKIRQVSKKWRKLFITYPDASTSSIYFYNNSATITNFYIRNIKLEYGEKTSPYSTLGCGSIELKLCNKNILNIEKDSSIESNGLEITTDEYGTLTFNGTTMANLYVSLDLKYIGTLEASIEQKKFKKGTYVFSSENLTDIIDINLSAYIRQTAAGGEVIQYSSLYRPFGAKSKNAKFKLEEDVEAVAYLWIASGIKFDNAKIKFQIELGETATDIVAHEEQNYIIPVQQRMFSGDKFVKLDGQWKEMHTMGTVYSKDVSNIVVSGSAVSGVDGFYRYNVNLKISNRKYGSYIRLYSNYFKYGDSRWNNKEGICGWENGQNFCIGTFNKNFDTAGKLKTFLLNNPVIFYYELAEPLYLDCTKEQIEILDKIEKEAHTYKEVTNVYTEDEVGAILKTNTNVDLKSLINNIQEHLIAQQDKIIPEIITSVIKNKNFELKDILYKINKMWIESAITEEEKAQLDELAREKR